MINWLLEGLPEWLLEGRSLHSTGQGKAIARVVSLVCIASLVMSLMLGFGGGAAHAAETLRVVGFNVESGDANPNTIADQIGPLDGIDLWGFSEVKNEDWLDILEFASEVGEGGADFETVLGRSGREDRLAIVYNADRLTLLEVQELDRINPGGRVRSPLAARFRLDSTGATFWFMVNHLYRSSISGRFQQARQLNVWARTQSLPVIAVGDYNFDWDIPSQGAERDRGFDLFTADGVFEWVRPAMLVQTQCNPRFNTVLDFIFVSGRARQWSAQSEILFPEADYCIDDERTSDHRPIFAEFVIPTVAEDTDPEPVDEGAPRDTSDLRFRILQRIDALERELDDLRRLVETAL